MMIPLENRLRSPSWASERFFEVVKARQGGSATHPFHVETHRFNGVRCHDLEGHGRLKYATQTHPEGQLLPTATITIFLRAAPYFSTRGHGIRSQPVRFVDFHCQMEFSKDGTIHRLIFTACSTSSPRLRLFSYAKDPILLYVAWDIDI
eukprot:scaffold282_cov345-Pavlova_lutheri.AAC.23